MADFLLKTEPSDYSFADLVKEKQTIWTGVKTLAAIRHLLSTKKGDRLVIYHTGDVKAAVGLATVVSADTDPKSPTDPQVVITAGKRVPPPPRPGRDQAQKGFAAT